MGQSGSVDAYAHVEVVLDKDVYSEGETISGFVSAQVIQQSSFSELVVEFAGDMFVVLPHDQFHKTFLTTEVLKKKFRDNKLKPGNYQFPFSLALATVKLPTLEFMGRVSEQASIKYEIKVSLKTPGWFKSKKTVAKTCLEIRTLPSQVSHGQNNVVSNTFRMNYGFAFFKTLGDVHVHGVTDDAVGVPGQVCSLSIYMKNESNADFEIGSVKLQETVKLQAKKSSALNDEGLWKLSFFDLTDDRKRWLDQGEMEPGVRFGQAGKITAQRFSIMLPMNLKHETMQHQNIAVTYEFVVKLVPKAFWAENKRIRIPIVVYKKPVPRIQRDSFNHGLVAEALPVAQVVHENDVVMT